MSSAIITKKNAKDKAFVGKVSVSTKGEIQKLISLVNTANDLLVAFEGNPSTTKDDVIQSMKNEINQMKDTLAKITI